MKPGKAPWTKKVPPPVGKFPESPNVNVEEFVQRIVSCLPGPNYLLKTQLCDTAMNIKVWEKYRHVIDSSDPNLIDQIAFGFPAAIDKNRMPSVPFTNHKSAIVHYNTVDEYITKHTATGAIAGPFDVNPLPVPVVVSPLQVACSASGKLRVVCDMSYGRPSVNDLISSDWAAFPGYFGDFNLPSSDSLAAEIIKAGRGCLLFKSDMRAFYKQLRADPCDVPYLGFAWRKKIFLDLTLPFGMRSSALCAQRVSNAIVKIHLHLTSQPMVAYIDDHLGIARAIMAVMSYLSYHKLTDDLGVEKSLEKCHKPLPETEYLGLEYDTNLMIVALPSDKLDRVIALLESWLQKTVCSKKELQKLVGVLNHCAYVVHPGRPFTARLLDALRGGLFPAELSQDFHKDVTAWLQFLKGEFSGRAILKNVESIPVNYSLQIAVAGEMFAVCVGNHNLVFKVANPPENCNESVVLCCAINYVSCHCVAELSTIPHLVSVPTKVQENVVNRARIDHQVARQLLRDAWISQARGDFVIKAKALEEHKNLTLFDVIKNTVNAQEFVI